MQMIFSHIASIAMINAVLNITLIWGKRTHQHDDFECFKCHFDSELQIEKHENQHCDDQYAGCVKEIVNGPMINVTHFQMKPKEWKNQRCARR